MVRCWALVAAVGFAGCESLKNPPPPVTVPAPAPADPPASASLPPPPTNTTEPLPTAATAPAEAEPDDLTRVAECLEKGERTAAAIHLEAYVRRHPDQIMFRAQLAEMFVRVGRDDRAKVHFERFAADARNTTGAPRDHLVHTHTRLMEIGQRTGDRFAEVFHRGVGLLLLVQEQDRSPDRDADFCEEMLCKAMQALAEAKELKPGDVTARLFLAEVHDRAGNRRAADVERAAARNSSLPGSGVGARLVTAVSD